jgi:hypothetical protein
VSDHDFVFALDLSDPAQLDSMLAEVARAVFVHVGYSAEATGELTAALRSAVIETTSAKRRCAVRFEAGAGQLQMTVSCDGGGEWRASRPLP